MLALKVRQKALERRVGVVVGSWKRFFLSVLELCKPLTELQLGSMPFLGVASLSRL